MGRSTQDANGDGSENTEASVGTALTQPVSSGSPDKSIAGDIPQDVSGPYDFNSEEDYLELNDLQGVSTLSASSDNSSLVSVNSVLTLPVSSENPDKSIVGDIPEDVTGPCDFTLEDYLELNDLPSLTTSSASSDNSSPVSVNSNEYFDVDAFLREIQNDRSMVEEEHVDGKLNIPVSVEPNQVDITMHPSGSVLKNDNLAVEERSPTSPSVTGRVSRSRSEGSLADDVINSSHNGRTSHQGSPISRIAKLGKKYCCFGSF